MRQAKVIVHVIQGQLLAQARLVFAQRDNAPTDRSHMLANRAVRTLYKGRVDLPARGCQHLCLIPARVPKTTRWHMRTTRRRRYRLTTCA